MGKQVIDRGTVAGDGTGETLFDAFGKCINNFDELYANFVALYATTPGNGASDIGIYDGPNNFTSTNVEEALHEILSRIAATTSNEGASLVGVYDVLANFTATDVEAVLAELFAKITAHETALASVANGAGASLVGIEDSAGKFLATDVEGALAELNTVINVKSYGAVGDGTTDDTTAIQAAMASLVNGDSLFFPSGSYLVGQTSWVGLSLTSKTNIKIYGEGSSTVITIKVQPSQANGVGGDKVLFKATSMSNFTLRDMAFNNPDDIAAIFVDIESSTNCLFENITFSEGEGLTALFALGNTGNRYNKLIAKNGGGGGGACRGLWIGHTSTGKSEDNCIISDCIAHSNGASGLVTVCRNSNIHGNISYSNAGSGLAYSSDGIGDSSYNNTITGNYFYDNDFSGLQWDISNSGQTKNTTVVGNVCVGNKADGILHIRGSFTTIVGNTCFDNNSDGTGTGVGIHLNALSKQVSVTGNTVGDTRTSGQTQTHGIYVYSPEGGASSIEDIILSGNLSYNNLNVGIAISNLSPHEVTGVTLVGNRVCDNGTSGIWIADAVPGEITEIDVIGNSSVGNASADRNDAKSYTSYSNLQTPTATTTQLADNTSAINTVNKFEGKQVFNTTTNMPVWADGPAAASYWVDATATLAHAPV